VKAFKLSLDGDLGFSFPRLIPAVPRWARPTLLILIPEKAIVFVRVVFFFKKKAV